MAISRDDRQRRPRIPTLCGHIDHAAHEFGRAVKSTLQNRHHPAEHPAEHPTQGWPERYFRALIATVKSGFTMRDRHRRPSSTQSTRTRHRSARRCGSTRCARPSNTG